MYLEVILVFFLKYAFAEEGHCREPNRPNIIFIYADDLGWNDISFHGSPQIPTPNIDALAASGVILNNYYGECLCTPSRGALMSGKYPIRLGLQHHVIRHGEPSGLPLDITTLPQHLKGLGYDTHMVGKWHLGYMKKEYTPTYRGFDTFFGYHSGEIDYYDYTGLHKTKIPSYPIFFGIDLFNGTRLVKDVRGQYATEMFTEKAKNIIRDHDCSKPLFLYLSHLAVHNGNDNMPLQAPPKQVNKFHHIKSEERKVFGGVVSSLDESVGAVFEALNEKGLLHNSIVLFVSDNGGDTNPDRDGYQSNYPLRGVKFTFWEGGVHVPAVVWSPLLRLNEPRVSSQLMHVTDWLPTLYSAAGGDVKQLGNIDGHNMWDAIACNLNSPRQELLHGLDPIRGMYALRKGDLKILTGNFSASSMDPWYDPSESSSIVPPDSMDQWVFQYGSIVKNILMKAGWYLPKQPDAWRTEAVLKCSRDNTDANECNPLVKPCLFNIKDDPCEQNNIADQYPQTVESMLKALQEYEQYAVEPQFQDSDPHADPRCHGFGFVPWLDPEHISDCPFK